MTVSASNSTLSYHKVGKGKPIVFLHGFCEDRHIWEELSEYLQTEFKVITIDLPGFGKSTDVISQSIDEMADHVHALLEKLNVGKYFLIGHSMGGYVSLAMAAKQSHSILGLGLLHSHPFADSAEKKTNRNKAIEFIERNGHIHYVKQLIPNLFGPAFIRSNSYIISKLILRASRISSTSITNALVAMRDRPSYAEVLERIDCPVLMVIGELDNIVPPELSKKQLTLPQVGYAEILPEVGHMALFEVPRQTRQIVRNFLKYCLELK